MPHRKKICVLVLDGENSTKAGVYPSFIQLREIMGRTAYDEGLEESETLPCKYFDLIVGSGDGGWAALLLGRLGMSASRAMAVYRQIHTAVHHTEPDLSAESKALKLEKLLQDLICSETKCKDLNSERLETTSDAQSCCRTAVLTKTAAHMASPILFRTYRVRDNPAVNCPIWQAIRACTAAPDVLPEVNIDGQQFTSAAHLGHSNPIELALSEAKTEFPDSEVDCIVSLGSGHPGHHSYQSSELSAYEKAAVHIAQDSELRAQAVTKQLNETGQAHIYFRLNVEQGLQSYMQAECPGYDDARTHTEQYLRRTEVGEAINKIVARLRGQCSTGASNMAPVIPLENIVHQETVHFQLSNAHPVQTYMDVLYELNMGLPLWDPQPFSKVVEIGDVGVLSEEGGFETFFNATVPADRQRYRVPPKFTPLELNPSNISSVPDAVRRPYLHNGDMTLTQIVGLENNGGGSGSHDQAFTLSFEVSNGAVLILKDPPTRLSIPPSPRVRAYLEKHYKAWYDWCRSAKGLDRDLEGRELIFVTGVYRSLDWAMGAWERIGIQRTVSYSGVATISGTVCKLTGLWTPALSRGIQNGPSQERPDPEYPALHPWRTEDIGAQCLFIRGYKIGVKQDLRHFPAKPILSVPDPTSDSKKIAWLNRLKNIRKAFKMKIPLHSKAAAGVQNLPPPPPPPAGEAVAAKDILLSPSPSLEEIQAGLPPTHPLDKFMGTMFEALPSAQVTIVHDDDLQHFRELSKEGASINDLLELRTLKSGEQCVVLNTTTNKDDTQFPDLPDVHDLNTVAEVPREDDRNQETRGAIVPHVPGISTESALVERMSLAAASIAFLKPLLQIAAPAYLQRSLRLPLKKALLIAICTTTHMEEFTSSPGSAEDVKKFRALLIEQYGFAAENVTMMNDLEPSCPEDLQPNRENIMRELNRLTADVQPGDEFVFYYTGHSYKRAALQEPHDDAEEGVRDELLVAMDGEEITSNELHMFLIAPLIPASSLIAILDTSHSQRLLDLSHYRCNRVSNRFTNMHRSAQRKASEAKLSITSQLHRIPALQHTPAQPVSPQASIDQGFPRDRSRSHRATDHEFCDGMCHRVSTRNQPSVVCISAGPDTLVDPKLSMTSVLVDVLTNEPRPTLKHLMTSVIKKMIENKSQATQAYQNQYFQWLKARSKRISLKELRRTSKLLFSSSGTATDPQLSSLSPLFMDDHLSL